MKSVGASLAAVLVGQNVHFRANLYTIGLTGPLSGTVLYLTDADQNLTVGGQVYAADQFAGDPGALPSSLPDDLTDTYTGASPYGVVRRSRSRVSSDLSIDDVDVYLTLTPLANSLSVPVNALMGSFDGCTVTIAKCFMAVYGDVSDAVPDAQGTAYPVDISSTQVRISVRNVSELLQAPLPKRLIQANCPYVLGGPGCGVTVPTSACTCAAGSTAQVLNLASGSATNASAYAYVKFTSGALSGQTRPVRATGTSVSLLAPFQQAPAVGDAFTLYAGCDKSRAGPNGCGTFSNLVNFGGFPDTPKASLSGQ